MSALSSGGKDLYCTVTEVLESMEINLSDCRGQSYDNAANMSSPDSGLQARFKAGNSYTEYILYSAHFLNLVGDAAASCCPESSRYLLFVHSIYDFLAACPSR